MQKIVCTDSKSTVNTTKKETLRRRYEMRVSCDQNKLAYGMQVSCDQNHVHPNQQSH